MADGIGMFMPAALATVDSLPQPVASDTLFCPGSFRVIATDSSNRFAVWWSSRASSRAQLMFAMTGDGGRTWSEATVVDGRDEGTRGCERPAPDIFTVSESEYVHVVYWIEPPGQPGVYFSHSMDNGHMFHAPVAVSYGDKPSRATVAARGDTVAVAYEDPNSARPRVWLALSVTAGHIFEQRMDVPGDAAPQSSPKVAVMPGTVAVGWSEPNDSSLVVRRLKLPNS